MFTTNATANNNPNPTESLPETVLEIPPVTSCSKLPVRGQVTDIVVKRIRDWLWSSPASPPSIETPGHLLVIRKKGNSFEDAIHKLLNASEVGVSIQSDPEVTTQEGRGRLLSFSTKSEVIIFDLMELGPSVLMYGLGEVLTNPDCVKVVHDARILSDILLQYGVDMVNVFDTMAAHFIFARWLTVKEITRTKPLFSAVRDYLGVTANHLNISRRRSSLQGTDLLMSAARDTMYLLELKRFLQYGLQLPVRRASKIAMEASVTLSDEEANLRLFNAHIVPNKMKNLPIFSDE